MNIVLHIPQLTHGGAERQITYLAKGLVERGYGVHVVTFYCGGIFWEELSEDPRIILYCLDRKSKWDFSIAYTFLIYCRDNNVDLIQAFLEPCTVIASLAAKIMNIPLVTGIRSSNMKLAFGSRLYKLADRFIVNRLAIACVCNSYSGMSYTASLGYREDIMCVIPNGLDLPDFKHEKPFNNGEVIRLGSVSRLDPKKDLSLMFEAFSLILNEINNIELHIYGDGEEQYKQQLRELCRKLCIEDKVVWRGWASSTWRAYEEIDVLISSSAYGEGMSNTLMEAMASERVIVVTDVGDAGLLMQDACGQIGYLIPWGEPKKMSDTILFAINNKNESLLYAKRGKVNIERKYSVDAMVSAYDKLYKRILS